MKAAKNNIDLLSKVNIYRLIRYIMIILLFVAIIIFASGKSESKAFFSDVAAAVEKAADFPVMEKSVSRYLKKIYDLNAEDFENVLIYIPANNMSANELLLIKLSDSSQSDSVIAAIEERVASQLNIFEGYAPEQVAILENAIIDDQGNYILYVSGPEAEKVDEVFKNNL